MLKVCGRCASAKPLHGFNRNRANRDGLQTSCRQCQIIANRLSSERHPETRRRLRRRKPTQGDRNCDPVKRRAHHVVEYAKRRGVIVKPTACQACGTSSGPIHAHHDDYAKPLEIQWLCARCHGRRHAGVGA